MEDKVFVVVSLQNGYRIYEGVFMREVDAMKYAQTLAESWLHKDHEIRVIKASLL